ncbi:3'(2'),5'-bisphosphate nucleotidase CysQ [Oceanicaulis sp. LC35]|uniref:3'(2'),5'-bisphosphate nucleotidase CysQ n=1 Tax=Oceanicaulis sp. LC35 TaxID=3349635 RepID=UPI003F8313C2
MTLDALARSFGQICLEAAIPVMEVYESDFTAEQKADKSPVTEADKRAEIIILKALAELMPDVPVLAEESFEAGIRPSVEDEFLLVDPVDGTKEFIAKRGEFTINIALIRNGVPVAGAVFAPALNQLYLGGETAFTGAFEPGETLAIDRLKPAKTREKPASGMTAVMSRSHADDQTKAFAEAQGVTEAVSAGSSLKFCKLAEGAADLYPRFGPTMEWDTAAGHAVLKAAGGAVTEPDGAPFRYGKTEAGYKNGAFVAWAQPPR